MAREELRLQGTKLKPVASPVSTYVRPGPGNIDQLSSALGQFAAGHKRAVLIRDEMFMMDAEERAEALFTLHKDELKSWKDAIRMDPDLAGESPYFKYQMEHRMGAQLGRDVTDALMISPSLMQSEDFDTDAGAILDELAPDMGEQSEAFKLGLARTVERGFSAARQQNRTARRQETLVAGQLALADEVVSALDDGENVEAIVAALQTSIGVMDNNVANNTVMNAIGNYALRKLDVTILDLMDQIPQGPGGFMGHTDPARSLKKDITEKIIDRKTKEDDLYWKQLGRTRTVLAERVFTDVSQRAGEEGFEIDGYLQALNANGMSHLADNLKALVEQRISTNEPMAGFDTRGNILSMIWNDYDPMTAPRLAQMRIAGIISEVDYTFGQNQMAMRDNASAGGNAKAGNQYATHISNAGKRVRLSEPNMQGFASTALDTQLEVAAKEAMALQLEIEQEALLGMSGPERLIRLGEIEDQVVSYFRRQGIEANTGRAGRAQDQEDQVIFRRDYERVYEYSREEFLPEGAASQAINLIMDYEPVPDATGLMPNDDEAAKILFRSLPPEVRTWAMENDINVAGGEFLLQLFGQRAHHRRKPRSE